jgi:acetylornithine deacetylase/succinyl-diaminopimelate desuccinylase-like protein
MILDGPMSAWTRVTGAAGALALLMPAMADEAGRPAFRAIYEELVEINTTLSAGSCTAASEAMAAHLKKAGFPSSDIQIITAPDRPKDGNLVAIMRSAAPTAKPLLLLSHIDVVEANREDWERDPFTLVEEGGYFYARGAADDKAMAAVFVDTLVRLKAEGFAPSRDIKLALTCGEETPSVFNGVQYLLKNHRDLIDAAITLNEGAGGRLDEKGEPVFLGIQAGEKTYQDYTLVVTNPGGHSSRPVKDNAIYHLSAGLDRLGKYDFPVALNEVTKTHFERMAEILPEKPSAALKAVAANPADAASVAAVAEDPSRNAMMRTTCVATMIDAGHAPNALPQRAEANVNCRILPGETVESVQQALVRIVADDKIAVSVSGNVDPEAPMPPLTPEIMGAAEAVAATIWPGIPLIPTMATGATDGRYMNAAGIPTYGLSGMFGDPDGGGVHGLNERIRVKSLYDGRDFLFGMVKVLSAP